MSKLGKAVKPIYPAPAKRVERRGTEVTDCGDYFRIVFDGLETVTVPKRAGAFETAQDVLNHYIPVR